MKIDITPELLAVLKLLLMDKNAQSAATITSTVILALIARVEELEADKPKSKVNKSVDELNKEADWLAAQIAFVCRFVRCGSDCPLNSICPQLCHTATGWRDAAQSAIRESVEGKQCRVKKNMKRLKDSIR